MNDFLWAMVVVGFAGFIIGLYCQYRSRNRFKMSRNRMFGIITAISLVIMLAGVVLLKIIG